MQISRGGAPADRDRSTKAWQYTQGICSTPAWTVCGKAIGCTGAGSVPYQKYQSPPTRRTETPKYPRAAMATSVFFNASPGRDGFPFRTRAYLPPLTVNSRYRATASISSSLMDGFGIAGKEGFTLTGFRMNFFSFSTSPLYFGTTSLYGGPTILASNRWQTEQTVSYTFFPFSRTAASPAAGFTDPFPPLEAASVAASGPGGAESPWEALPTAAWSHKTTARNIRMNRAVTRSPGLSSPFPERR